MPFSLLLQYSCCRWCTHFTVHLLPVETDSRLAVRTTSVLLLTYLHAQTIRRIAIVIKIILFITVIINMFLLFVVLYGALVFFYIYMYICLLLILGFLLSENGSFLLRGRV